MKEALNKEPTNYDDILNYPYPNPEIEADFPDKIQRAAQFAPFAALTGHDEMISETARLTDSKSELDEYAVEEINRKINYLRANPKTSAVITYFIPDEKKKGGAYVKACGTLTKTNEFEKTITLNDDTVIATEDIYSIEYSSATKDFNEEV